jgi:hypothetical protein
MLVKQIDQTSLLADIIPLARPGECKEPANSPIQHAKRNSSFVEQDMSPSLLCSDPSANVDTAQLQNCTHHPTDYLALTRQSLECSYGYSFGAVRQCLQFPWKLHDMLDSAEREGYEAIVSWLPDKHSFKVHKPDDFAKSIIPYYFKLTKFKSFRRQINMWGFERIKDGPGKGGYKHPNFVRGVPSLCCLMKRVKIKGTATTSNSNPAAGVVTPQRSANKFNTRNEEEHGSCGTDWLLTHETSLLKFAQQVICASIPEGINTETFTPDEINDELITTFQTNYEAPIDW